MKSYLSLIPISAKVHKRQSRMTRLCILFSVFLVTAVFSMAEMAIRMEGERLVSKHGRQSLTELLSSDAAQNILPLAVFLFLLILAAGVFMISGSMNSNVAQRTKFFGMMRCIGMSRQQIIRFVRLEALNWCKTAIPLGVALGIGATWVLCAVLRFLVGEEFSGIPLFGVSAIGIFCGVALGVITVLIAASAPARQAAKVSPVTAVSGSADIPVRHAANTRLFKIETALGIHHAVSSGKNLFLMTGSFALSIVLFLSFSVLIELVGYIMPQSYAAPDIEISCTAVSETIAPETANAIAAMDAVTQVYGRKTAFALPAVLADGTACEIDLISFDDFDLEGLRKDGTLKQGSGLSKVYGDSAYVLATWDQDSPLQIGDTLTVDGQTLTIGGLLKYDPFTASGTTEGQITLISSAATFTRLTGCTGYTLLMAQVTGDMTEEDLAAIRSLLPETCTLRDLRDQSTANTYTAFLVCVYGFLLIITLVSVLNIVNSISMSVSARTKQYGAIRAVGMDAKQITTMIAAEATTYALFGCLTGCTLGLLLSKLLYDSLITSHYSYALWHLPTGSLVLILLFLTAATALAVHAPAKRIRTMSITETINEL